jgi:integrase
MKSNREHAVPLSALALEVLERRRLEQRLKGYTGDAVFPGQSGSPIGYAAFARAPAEVGVNAGTPHSWRSLFSDWAGDIGRVDPDLSEAALAHTLGKVRGAYRRQTAIEARRPVMEAYAKWLCGDAGADILAFPTSSRA